MQILIVLTSHDQLGDTGRKTGFWLEELAAPWYVFRDAGVELTLASPAGGQAPIDPASEAQETPDTQRFKADSDAMAALASTDRLADVDLADFDAVFYPGGHGPLWDLANDEDSIALIEDTLDADKPLGLVCHAPGALREAITADGHPVVRGRRVTGFANSEEAAAGLTDVVPFLVEDMLKEQGGLYEKADDQQVKVIVDGLLVTGQNPASSGPAAEALLALLQRRSGLQALQSGAAV